MESLDPRVSRNLLLDSKSFPGILKFCTFIVLIIPPNGQIASYVIWKTTVKIKNHNTILGLCLYIQLNWHLAVI